MDIPQEIRDIESEITQSNSRLIQARYKLENFRVASSRFDKFADNFHELDTSIRESEMQTDATLQSVRGMIVDIEMASAYTKDFDLLPGDRVRITMPAQGSFPAGWSEGEVITANWYWNGGWYIESEKDNVSYGWQTGYGYWKQDTDGGTVEKLY